MRRRGRGEGGRARGRMGHGVPVWRSSAAEGGSGKAGDSEFLQRLVCQRRKDARSGGRLLTTPGGGRAVVRVHRAAWGYADRSLHGTLLHTGTGWG